MSEEKLRFMFRRFKMISNPRFGDLLANRTVQSSFIKWLTELQKNGWLEKVVNDVIKGKKPTSVFEPKEHKLSQQNWRNMVWFLGISKIPQIEKGLKTNKSLIDVIGTEEDAEGYSNRKQLYRRALKVYKYYVNLRKKKSRSQSGGRPKGASSLLKKSFGEILKSMPTMPLLFFNWRERAKQKGAYNAIVEAILEGKKVEAKPSSNSPEDKKRAMLENIYIYLFKKSKLPAIEKARREGKDPMKIIEKVRNPIERDFYEKYIGVK